MDAMKLPKHSKMRKIKAEGRVSVDKDTIKHVQLISQVMMQMDYC